MALSLEDLKHISQYLNAQIFITEAHFTSGQIEP
jgi:hypothetical protein